jgi:hypothetical protein
VSVDSKYDKKAKTLTLALPEHAGQVDYIVEIEN